MPPQIAAISSNIKFNELSKKPHIYRIFLASLVISITSFISEAGYGQPLVLSNGQSTLEGLDTGYHLNSPTRTKIDLAGTWTYSFEYDSWIDKILKPAFSGEIKVPSSIDFEGQITFRRNFTIEEELLNKSAFKFVALGINYECEIYVNDVFIGKHIGGYTSFEFEIPEDILQIGKENTIKVITISQLSARSTLPVRKQIWGWKNYAGILRDVYILVTPRLWIDRASVSTSFDSQMKQATVSINGTLSNKKFSALNRDSILAKSKQTVYFLNAELHERYTDLLVAQAMSAPLNLEPNKETQINLILTVNVPKLWSPENPELYILKTSIVTVEGKQKAMLDQYSFNMGFASVRVEKNVLMLNGNKLTLKGVVWHEDSPLFGASLTYEQMEKDVVLIKSLGANAVRFAFHPPHPYMLNLCSRYGLAVLEEMPVWNVPADILNEESFQSLAEAQAQEMVERDGHFPCVIAWGIGDQFDSADKQALGYVQKIAGTIRKLDNRLVYYGSRMLNNEECASAVDFVGVVLPSTDLKNFRRLLSDWKKNHSTQPIVVLSYGKEVDQNNRNGYSDPVSQESQARFYLQHYAAIKEAGSAGSFASALSDWRGDRPILTTPFANHYIYPVGLLSQAREKRLAYDVVRALYNEERIIAIPAGSYRASFPWTHVLVGLFVIILIGYQSTNRRFAESFKRSLLRSYNFFVDLRDLHTVSILHTFILASAISITLAGLLSSIMYHYRGDKFADYIITYLIVMDPLKELFIHATWRPFAGIAALTGIFFLCGVLVALLIKIFAFFIRARVAWFHVYSVSVWSAAPVIFLSPLAMSLFKIMENPPYVLPSIILILLFLFWTFLRVLKGMSVIYDLSTVKATVAGIFVCAILLGGLFFYYDSIYAISSYVKFILHLSQNLG